jgi:hypothetical protein
MTKCRDYGFPFVRLGEIALTYFQLRVPLGIFVDCQCHVNYDLSIDLVVLGILRV